MKGKGGAATHRYNGLACAVGSFLVVLALAAPASRAALLTVPPPPPYPIPDKTPDVPDVDKTHTGKDARGQWTGIPTTEKDACWLAASAAALARVWGKSQAWAESWYADRVAEYVRADPVNGVPGKTGVAISDWLTMYFLPKRLPFWAETVSIDDPQFQDGSNDYRTSKDSADKFFRQMIGDAQSGAGIVLCVVRNRFGWGVSGHVVALDGWQYLNAPYEGGALSVTDADADYIAIALPDDWFPDNTWVHRSTTRQTIVGTTGWYPTLRYPRYLDFPVYYEDYIFAYVKIARIPEPACAALLMGGMLVLLARRGGGGYRVLRRSRSAASMNSWRSPSSTAWVLETFRSVRSSRTSW